LGPYSHFYKKLENTAKQLFPGLASIAAPTWDHLISPLEVRLPMSVYTAAENAIRAFHSISRRAAYQQQLEVSPGISDVRVPHESVLMAYDFHTLENGECRLVEVNTNASGYLLTSLMQMTHFDTKAADLLALQQLRQSFVSEAQAFGVREEALAIAITDEDLEQQKMFLEFLMYRDWFRANGWRAEFCESKDFQLSGRELRDSNSQPVNFVYNRSTDFYLEQPQHQALRDAFAAGAACLSPNPREYWLLADKQRLIQLTTPGFLEQVQATSDEIQHLQEVLIPTFEKSALGSSEEIWAQRRSLFFKPKRSHGGKSVYRGESVSRKVFERLMQEDILIQHYTPAQRFPSDDPRSVMNNWKFDVRFYAYRDQIQATVARIYQGQVTNFASPLGGFTLVQFK
jgi:hypothetical protein